MPASTLSRWATYMLLLTMPLSVFWPVSSPLVPDVLPLYVTRGIYLSDIPLLLLLLISLFRGRYHTFGRLGIILPLLGLGILGLLTVPSALAPSFALYVAMRWLLAFTLTIWLVQGELPAKQIIAVLVAGLCLQAIIALAQVVAQRPLGLPGELTLPPAISGAAIIEVGETRWLRPYGLTFHPNVLAGYLTIGLILFLPFLGTDSVHASHITRHLSGITAHGSRLTAYVSRWLPHLAWLLLAAALLLTFSRAAWLAALVALPLVALHLAARHPEKRRQLATLLAGAAMLALTAAFLWRGQLATRLYPLALPFVSGGDAAPTEAALTEQYSLGERDYLNDLAVRLIRDRPLLGFGAGSFPIAMTAVQNLVVPQYAHNIPLLLSAETGILGGILWLILGLAGVLYLISVGRTDDIYTFGALAAWLALFIIALFDSYPWALDSGRLLTAVVLGLAGRKVTT